VTASIEIRPLTGLPEIDEGAPLGRLLAAAAEAAGAAPADGDAVVVSQKVVSKAEGRTRSLAAVKPGTEATELAERLGKDPRLVELVLSESRRIVRAERGVLIVETTGGWICANGGIDGSNVPGADSVTLLPLDADASARRIRSEIEDACGARPALVVTDSFGRPWRIGQADVAIGCAGLVALDDWRGRADASGAELAATAVAIADQVAAAADLVRVKDSGVPAALATGVSRWWTADDGAGAQALQRAAEDDLFR
jgi:coenzyme F420-0:L-glutamate ligase/coenzyme F420-1:gamma-L-glutamate ligase